MWQVCAIVFVSSSFCPSADDFPQYIIIIIIYQYTYALNVFREIVYIKYCNQFDIIVFKKWFKASWPRGTTTINPAEFKQLFFIFIFVKETQLVSTAELGFMCTYKQTSFFCRWKWNFLGKIPGFLFIQRKFSIGAKNSENFLLF